jgi:hypothetical protein
MTSKDWYRQTSWSTEVATEFFSKLGRARSQRDQYLVIQALTLASTHPKASLDLIDQYFATKGSDFENLRATCARAEAYRAQGNLADALLSMKHALEIERARPSQKSGAFVEYPYLVATKGFREHYEAALSTLEERSKDLAFPVQRFMWHAAMSLIHAALEQKEMAQEHAGLALDAAQVKKSGFRFHQPLGLVGKEHEATVERLRTIYA